jgi:hypothetical protein
MWKAKNKNKTKCASLPSGAVGKGHYVECSWQIRSATLGKIFPARVFPALPSVVARGARQRILFKKNKKTVFADDLCQGARHKIFLKK